MNKDEDKMNVKSMLNMLIHEYLKKNKFHDSANVFQNEASVPEYRESQNSSILLQWFRIFNDICLLRSGNKCGEAHLSRIESVMMKLENEKRKLGKLNEVNNQQYSKYPNNFFPGRQMYENNVYDYPIKNPKIGEFKQFQTEPYGVPDFNYPAEYDSRPEMPDVRDNIRYSRYDGRNKEMNMPYTESSNEYNLQNVGYKSCPTMVNDEFYKKYNEYMSDYTKSSDSVNYKNGLFYKNFGKNLQSETGTSIFNDLYSNYEKQYSSNFDKKTKTMDIVNSYRFVNSKIRTMLFSRKQNSLLILASKELIIIDISTKKIVYQKVHFGERNNILCLEDDFYDNNEDLFSVVATYSSNSPIKFYKFTIDPFNFEFIKEIEFDLQIISFTLAKNNFYILDINEEISKYSIEGKLMLKNKLSEDIRSLIWVRDDILFLCDHNSTFVHNFETNERITISYEPSSMAQKTDKNFITVYNEKANIYDINFKKRNTIKLNHNPYCIDLIDEHNVLTGRSNQLIWYHFRNSSSISVHRSTVTAVKMLDLETGLVATGSENGDVSLWCVKDETI